MRIRKIQYNIAYSHILSFKDDYKKITAPYFGWNKVRYTVENLNTINESLKLVFTEYNTVMHFRKDGVTIMFEGSDDTFLSDSSLLKEYFMMYNKIRNLDCYSRTSKHDLLVHAVDTEKKIESSDYLKINPYKEKMIDFACVYHYSYKNYDINISFGDYKLSDIEKYDLSPFKSPENKDLFNPEVGMICELRLVTDESEPTFAKLKKLFYDVNAQIKLIE